MTGLIYATLHSETHPWATPAYAGAYCGSSRMLLSKYSIAFLKSASENILKGEGHLVTIAGEAGIGKSRILFEFRDFLNSKSIKVVQGR